MGLPPSPGWLVGARVAALSASDGGRPQGCPLPGGSGSVGAREASLFPSVGGASSAASVVRGRWRPFATEGPRT